jgi:transposase
MQRFGLRDDQWARIKDFLPGREGHVGGNAADNRLYVEAVLYRYRTGIPWRDLPARFGDWKIVHQRFSRWAKSGVSSEFSSCWQFNVSLRKPRIDFAHLGSQAFRGRGVVVFYTSTFVRKVLLGTLQDYDPRSAMRFWKMQLLWAKWDFRRF